MKHSLKIVLEILIFSIPCFVNSSVIAQHDVANPSQNIRVEQWNIFEPASSFTTEK